MKKCRYTWIVICVMLLLSACAVGQQGSTAEEPSQAPTWQEQYDLGVRYLSEGNYQEAIIAFTAAIEIDPKKAPAYVGRGNAYVKSGETEENLTAAKADYKKAIELDETSAEAYLGLADVFLLNDDKSSAFAILGRGYEITNDEIILSRLEQMYNNRPDGASEMITANGCIIDNMKEYTVEIEQIRELYFDREVNGTRYYNISSFGVRFTEPINVLVSGESVSLVEANFVFGSDDVFSVETPVASVVNQTIRITGYFYKRTQTENTGENHEMYWPNGDYYFAITGYEQIE